MEWGSTMWQNTWWACTQRLLWNHYRNLSPSVRVGTEALRRMQICVDWCNMRLCWRNYNRVCARTRGVTTIRLMKTWESETQTCRCKKSQFKPVLVDWTLSPGCDILSIQAYQNFIMAPTAAGDFAIVSTAIIRELLRRCTVLPIMLDE